MYLAIISLVGAVLLGLVGSHLWEDRQRNKELATLREDYGTVQGNYDTCQAANETNAATIAELETSITNFVTAQQAERERAQAEAAATAARHAQELEQSRRNRERVAQVLSAEACSVVEYPDDVASVLNHAITKASGQRGDDG